MLEHFVSRGMIVDVCFHEPDREPPNPHFHFMCPISPLNPDGSWGQKQRREYLLDENRERVKDEAGHDKFNAVPTTDWGDPETLEFWREKWAEICNAMFEEKGLPERIDHRSYERQGIHQIPTIHEGPAVRATNKIMGLVQEHLDTVTTYNQYVNMLNNHIAPYFNPRNTTVVKEKIGDNVVSTVRDNTTKTDYSRRSLPLCPYTYQYFCTLRNRQLAQMELCGDSYNRQYLDFECVDEMGMLLQPDFVSQKFQKPLVKYNLRPIRFHDLRHSCATIMLYPGFTMKDIQTWLGHSNYSFTANTYVHSSKQSHVQMAQSFSENLPVLVPAVVEAGV